ncbi:hypothetical protein MYA_3903 [Burkholderia stabilis]|nr:hypothetical protein MYA_3903 [Burkholderia stabilis]
MTLLKRQEIRPSSAQVFRKIIGNSCCELFDLIRQVFPNRSEIGKISETLRSPQALCRNGMANNARNYFLFFYLHPMLSRKIFPDECLANISQWTRFYCRFTSCYNDRH